MPGGRLTSEDRQRIAAGLAEGLGYAEIARRLERPASTVMREVTRNGGPDDYRAERAQEATRHRARRSRRAQPAAWPAPDGDHGRDPQAVRDFAESFTTLLEQQGLPRMAAKVLVCLYVTDSGTLTAADLVQRLRVSPASVSHAVAFLEQQGLLRRSGPRRAPRTLCPRRRDLAPLHPGSGADERRPDGRSAARGRDPGSRDPGRRPLRHLGRVPPRHGESLREGMERWRQISTARQTAQE
ncbi:helix-turn-helix domain-containing protein [Streptomyces sp. CC228A]|uniref:helix-turn-helix domain-containing protein n=1 Tax=Streptomyces sp. CC228A TaxID=2898186 RepID=UPI001F23B388|nr:helix-turn-helix domain-containing protein [Streptomyces sp. CC228A]